MKKIKRIFHGGNIDKTILIFSIGYLNAKRRKEMTPQQRLELSAFLKECKSDIDLFISEIDLPIITATHKSYATYKR